MNARHSVESTIPHGGVHSSRRPIRFGILGSYPPTVSGQARFTAGLARALSAEGADVAVVRIADGQPAPHAPVVGTLVNGSASSAAACADVLNQHEVAIIQHGYGIYGGADGEDLVDILVKLVVPSIVVIGNSLKDPTPQQRSILAAIAAAAHRIVVTSGVAMDRLCITYDVDRRKTAKIPYGATLPSAPRSNRPSRPTILTWGLLGPGTGVERVIDAMAFLDDVPGRPRYLVAGPTHPDVFAVDGNAYRDARKAQVQKAHLAGSVSFDPGYRDGAPLSTLIQSSSVVVLPYDSTEQVSSAVLVDAIANGRPVVATAFPHAHELLSSGAGIVVDHDDPAAMVSALRQVLTQPRLAGSMAGEARRLALMMAWPTVAGAYIALSQRLLTTRPAPTSPW